jgi:hypothetical protein
VQAYSAGIARVRGHPLAERARQQQRVEVEPLDAARGLSTAIPRTGLRGYATGLWTLPLPNFGY